MYLKLDYVNNSIYSVRKSYYSGSISFTQSIQKYVSKITFHVLLVSLSPVTAGGLDGYFALFCLKTASRGYDESLIKIK